MFQKTRTWCVLSVLLFAAAGACWWLGNVRRDAQIQPGPVPVATNTHPSSTAQPGKTALLTTKQSLATTAATNGTSRTATAGKKGVRVSNTALRMKDLMRSDTALLLRNALLDTTASMEGVVPEEWRSKGNPGAYIVQSRGAIGDEFRACIDAASAYIISYLPNNAYLVKADEVAARQLSEYTAVAAVLPYEPYYKVEQNLLYMALKDEPLPSGGMLKLTLFPGSEAEGREALSQLGAEVVAESRSPFGPLVTIKPGKASVASIARLASVQGIEVQRQRVLANDLTRPLVGVSLDSTNTTNYLGLTGTNVLINLNDSGVDAEHPDLKDRVLSVNSAYLTDVEGHGTHVAGIIASSGESSSTVTNAVGSLTNASFQGMAPMSKLFVLPVDILSGPLASDAYLQETAARTNAFISNNSWNYDGSAEYDSSAASYDAAVRDALPEQSGMQPLVYVFSAGNHGGGAEDGSGGESGGVRSPATAKNVISVGALEHYRNVTNEVEMVDAFGETYTNTAFLTETDSNDQVATYSSRGNVGVGFEGDYGRFKPDLVAPGTFIISTRSSQWEMETNPATVVRDAFYQQEIAPGGLNNYSIYVPIDASQVELTLTPNARYTNSFTGLNLYAKYGDFASDTYYDVTRMNEIVFPRDYPVRPGDWYYSVQNTSPYYVIYDIHTTLVQTNEYGTYFTELAKLQDGLSPHYRYESGTSMAAPVVSGMLALMKEFFEQKLPVNLRHTNSPAMMKALLINGAYSVNPKYDLSPRKTLNIQGWGMPMLTNVIPASLTNGNFLEGPLVMVDQSTTNSLATGQSATWDLKLSEDVQSYPLRFTLVWTDPPGNPNAAIKLVNDLDLVVTNLDSGDVYWGNDIAEQTDYNQTWDTNSTPTSDVVNNVENVFIRSAIGTNFSVTVVGRKVNVNAVTGHTNQVAQDFALVVSTAKQSATNTLTLAALTTPRQPAVNNALVPRRLLDITNGVPVLNERVGANSPLIGGTNGVTNQWNFYVFTNTMTTNSPLGITNGPNVAFITFLPPNLSHPRASDADIDMYVSTNPQLTNLSPAVLATADKSVARGGSELIAYTNALLDTVYYIAIKAEDQQASEYSFVGISSLLPFEEFKDGRLTLRVMPVPLRIPDGDPSKPGTAYGFAVGISPYPVGRVVVTNIVSTEDYGDLLGDLRHNNTHVVLNNHSLNSGDFVFTNRVFVFDDSNQGDVWGGIPTDGPGTLLNFEGATSTGLWLLTMADSALNHTSRVEQCMITITPQPVLAGLEGHVAPNSWEGFYLDVPVEATNMLFYVWDIDPAVPLYVYLKYGDMPSFGDYDKYAILDPSKPLDATKPAIQLGLWDVPPLRPGRYYVGVYNPNAVTVDYRIAAKLEYNLNGGVLKSFHPLVSPLAIKDDALTISTNHVPLDQEIVDIRVGLRVDHPRVSDLSFTLVSPFGTRVLLAENRGGTNATAYGATVGTNLVYATFAESTNLDRVPIKFATPPFTNSIIGSERFRDSFENATVGDVPVGGTLYNNWTVFNKTISVISDTNMANTGSNYVRLAGGGMRRIMLAPANREYEVSVTYRRGKTMEGLVGWWPGEDNTADIVGGNNGKWVGQGAYQAGRVSQAWDLNGLNNHVSVPASDALNTKGFTFEAWIYPTDLRVPRPIFTFGQEGDYGWLSLYATSETYPQSGEMGSLNAILRDTVRGPLSGDNKITTTNAVINLNAWNHVALSYNPTTRWARIYANGEEVARKFILNLTPGTMNPLQIGYYPGGSTDSLARRHFKGRIDEAAFFNRALSGAEIKAIFDAGDEGKCSLSPAPSSCPVIAEIKMPGAFTNTVVGSDVWQVFSTTFRSPGLITPLVITSLSGDMLIDDVVLREKGKIYLAEESLETFRGESGLGDWLLEVRDTRKGPGGSILPKMIDWKLDFLFATPAQNAVVLTNGIPFTNRVEGASTYYFIVEVPRSATYATNLLFGSGDLILIGNRAGLPTGDPLYDDYYVDNLSSGRGESLLLSTAQPLTAPLQPGGRYYLGVRNKNVNQTNDFTIVVTFDKVDQATNLAVTALTSGVSLPGRITNGVGMDYYQFTVSDAAEEAYFELFPTNGNVNLLLRKGRNVANPLPSFTDYDYVSANGGAAKDEIFVYTNSMPVALSSGVWYVGVYNSENFPVDYSIRATEILGLTTNVTLLQDDVPLDGSVEVSSYWTNMYHYVISETNADVTFDLSNLSGDVDLYVRRGVFPTETSFDSASLTLGTAQETITLATNASLPNLNGDWYLTAVNRDTNTVNFTIRAAVTPVMTEVSNAVYVTNTFTAGPGWKYYTFNVSTDAVMISFEALPLSGDVDLYVRYGTGSRPWPRLGNYDYRSEEDGNNLEVITVDSSSTPRALTSGIWYIGVYNPGANAATFSLVATELKRQTLITTLTNYQIVTRGNLGSNAMDYYRFLVSNTATQALFETFAANGDVNLYVRRGLPLPGPTNYHYASLNADSQDEKIVVSTNSSIRLDAGWWFLCVSNAATNTVNYSVRAVEITPEPPVIRPTVKLVGTNVTITWSSLVGSNYVLQGTHNISDHVIWSEVKSLQATNQVTTVTIPLPDPLMYFFRIKP